MGHSNRNFKKIYTFKLSKVFDCSLVERPFLKEKNSQCIFSHFNNRKVRKSTNQTIQHNRLSGLLIEKRSFFGTGTRSLSAIHMGNPKRRNAVFIFLE